MSKAFPFIRDGGRSSRNGDNRTLQVHKQLISRLNLQVGRYEPTIQRGRAEASVSIDLEPAATSYDAPEKIPSRISGVYRILDGDGIDIDIGCSKSDVRGRVTTKWRQEKEAASVLVYFLKSEGECLHWELSFQKRFERGNGRLPLHCGVRGKGCGCTACS